MQTKRKRIFLTGASSGIGLETARLLCAQDCFVWGTSRETPSGATTPNFHPVIMDLADQKSICDNFTRASNEAGGFDVLINNAGSGYFGPFEANSIELLQKQFQILVFGPLALVRLALPAMREQKSGQIINVSSLAAKFPIPYLGAYSAGKAALASFSATLRLELTGSPIHVVDVQPGDIRTGFHAATQHLDHSQIPVPKSTIETVWKTIEHNMAAAPPPERVAKAIWRVIQQSDPPPVLTVGNFFQTRLAPVLARLASPRLVEWSMRKYYGI